MRIKDEARWQKWQDDNRDPYGGAVIEYAHRWANLMEERMGADLTLLSSVAKQASHDADTEGITGFMYGAAVQVLTTVWEHGEALRRWHNLDTQISDEGERANASGGVLNPAVLNIQPR